MNGAFGATRRRSRQNSSMSPMTSTAALRASPTVQCGAGCVSGTPGASTKAAILLQSMWRRSDTGMPAARAFSTLASVSSHATTSAPPASSALALARPEAPSPNSATVLPAKLVIGSIAAALSPPPASGASGGKGSEVAGTRSVLSAPHPHPPPLPAMLRMLGGEHSELEARLSSQLECREAGEREHDRDDPEPDHDLRL